MAGTFQSTVAKARVSAPHWQGIGRENGKSVDDR
jgi:hypothetical protein